MFIGFPSYQANLRRLGFDDDDLVPGGSDRLIDRVVAWGTLDDVRRRVDELHVLTGQQRMPRAEWITTELLKLCEEFLRHASSTVHYRGGLSTRSSSDCRAGTDVTAAGSAASASVSP
jgi:hypothetical protein